MKWTISNNTSTPDQDWWAEEMGTEDLEEDDVDEVEEDDYNEDLDDSIFT